MEDHEDPEREQRDSAFDTDPEAERKMDERWAEMAAHAGAPDPRATDVLNKIISSKRFAAPVAAAAVSTMLRRPRLATQFYRHASSPATATRFSGFTEARRQFSTRVDNKFEQPLSGGLSIGDTPGMEFAKKAVHYSFWYFVGTEGDRAIRAAGNAFLEALERNAKEWEPSKWGPPFLAESRKEPVLGDGQDIDPEVDANVKEVYKDWYTQPESAFWTKYAQIISSTSMPLDGQFVALSLMSHLLPITEMYYWPSQDDALALLEACAQAVKDAGGKASAIYTCLAEHVDGLKLPRSIAIDMAQMVVSTLIQPAAPGNVALHSAGLKLLGDPQGDPVGATNAFLQNVSFMAKLGGVEFGPLLAGTLSFFQLMFPSNDGMALVNAFVKAVDHLLNLHDIQDMRDDINQLTDTYLGLASALDDYYKLNHKNMPRAELGKPGTTVYDTFMKPLVEECVQAGKLSGIVNTLITDERYKVDCIPLAMAAASLWMAYNGLYMQMCSYRDGQVSDDAATPYATVLRFIREHVPTLKDNVEKFKAARLQCVSEVQKHYNSDHRGGEHTTYFIDDSVGSDGVPPSLGHYEEETSTNIFGTDNGDAEAHVHSKRDEWVATVNSALVAWANTTVEDPVKQWWDNFVYQNSPYFYPPDPPSGPQVVPASGQTLEYASWTPVESDPTFDKWWSCNTVTYAITFRNDRGDSKMMESAPMQVEKETQPAFPQPKPVGPFKPPVGPIGPLPGPTWVVKNAQPDLTVPVDDTNPATVRLVFIKFDNGDWEPVPSAIAQLARDPKATRVSTR